jgi:hypothetical protein
MGSPVEHFRSGTSCLPSRGPGAAGSALAAGGMTW